MFEVKKEYNFSAAHHLRNYEGKCENMHGHNFKVEVFARGEDLNDSDILIDFKILKSKLAEIVKKLDHTDLNQNPYFKDKSPSSELIAKYIYTELKKEIPILWRVNIWETDTSCASYYEEN